VKALTQAHASGRREEEFGSPWYIYVILVTWESAVSAILVLMLLVSIDGALAVRSTGWVWGDYSPRWSSAVGLVLSKHERLWWPLTRQPLNGRSDRSQSHNLRKV
jgi:hypothetical protein